MITAYEIADRCLRPVDATHLGPATRWIDLVEPTSEEEKAVEAALGIAIPTRAEAREIEASSRLYRENGAAYMTTYVLYNTDGDVPGGTSLTFVLANDCLVSVRYHRPRAFDLFAARAAKGEADCTTAASILVGLIEAIVDRAADIIERTQDQAEATARRIFSTNKDSKRYARRLDDVLRAVGRQGDITARLEESMFSMDRLVAYLGVVMKERGEPAATMARLDVAQRDVRSLTEQMRFLTDRITFLLDATLGAISIEQNRVMKVFTMMAVTLMPPTLIGAIYGMNFKHMPELEWVSGYPLALGLMVLSGVLPLLYFRLRGWF